MTGKRDWSKPYQLLQEQIKNTRLSAKLTQAELANLFNKPQSFISKIEGGSRGISVVELNSICEACKTDIVKFIKTWREKVKQIEAQ